MDAWVKAAAGDIARRAERELEALVAVSSPSGDVHGAQECAALCAALAPEDARLERPPCSSPDHAPDVLISLRGSGRARVLMLGHVDTVVAHADHRPLERRETHLLGSGAVDMKGGVVLALGALRALAAHPERYAEVALLLVCDEEWRTGPLAHVERFAGWDACLCFEAGELDEDGAEGVVVQRKAAATLRVQARGRSAHSGSAPDRGRNALLALASAAQAVSACHDPHGPHRLSAVPTVLRSGEAFNVVPGRGELFCDCRADDLAAVDGVIAALPSEIGGVVLEAETIRRWPGMAAAEAVAPVLQRAAKSLGRPIRGVRRGGASDASHVATRIPVTIDGLGPRGGKAHNPGEFVHADSLLPRAEVALAVIDAVLGPRQ
jgi:glutamate carboxypeptidase